MPVAAVALLLTAPAPVGWPGYGGPTADFRVPALPPGGLAVLWRRPLGPGESQIVSDGTRLVTAYSIPDPADKKKGEEVIVALDPATGRTVWEYKAPVAMRAKQETFRGAPVGPQATPLLAAGKVFHVGFAGRLVALDAATGKEEWAKDLVAEFAATPVQFGFAASPVWHAGSVLVHAGGRETSVIALDPASGTVKWKTAAAEPGYATPVLATVAGDVQVIQLTRDAVIGYSAADGATRWTYPLPTKGLTNVPAPLPLPGDRVLVSGQGVGGTRLLKITNGPGGWSAAEVWANKVTQFFYCNWALDGDTVYGFPANGGKQFTALRWSDGMVRWTDPNQTEANVLSAGRELFLLRGDGRLTRATPGETGLEGVSSLPLLTGRCWVAPSAIGGRLYVRNGKEVVAVRVGRE